MVTMQDRVLIEARAKGLNVETMLHHPWRQLLKADVVISAVAVALLLLIYYTAVGFGLIYLSSVFGFSTKDANGLLNWQWGFNVIAVILIGMVSDLVRVRKPFMVLGGVGGAIMTVVYLEQAGHHPGYYTLAVIVALLSLFLGIAYTPWMASFTETVEARNPALIATGLAIWGWVIRVVVFVAFLIIPHVITSVTPLVNYGTTVQTYEAKYGQQIAFAQSHPKVIAAAREIQGAAGQRAEARARAGRAAGASGAVRQAGHLLQPGDDPAETGQPGHRRGWRRRQGPDHPDHHPEQQRSDRGRDLGGAAAAGAEAVRCPAHRGVQGSAVRGPVHGGPRHRGGEGRGPVPRPVEELVLGVLRRDHLLLVLHPAAAGPLESGPGPPRRGGSTRPRPRPSWPNSPPDRRL